MNNNFNKFNLDKNITKALYNLDYNKPSAVQEKVIPLFINKEDIVVKSKTGSGKTASFAIPICESIDITKNSVQALVVVPTRELAIQVKEEISNIGRLKKVRCSAIFGRQPIKQQINELKQRVHVVVATPGRIIDHITRETINIDDLKYFVIDEADKMLNKGFVDDMEFVFNKLPKNTSIGLFSATIDKDIEYICNKYMKDFKTIEIEDTTDINKKQIDEKVSYLEDEKKYDVLKNTIYYHNPKTTMIFLNTKDRVSELYNKMRKDKFLVAELHGDMSQEKRIFVIEDFKKGKYNVLVSTDVASRGIHIEDVSLVINYDVPQDKENYVHRIGRTGRKDKFGKAVTIVTGRDKKYIDEITSYIGYDIEALQSLEKRDIDKGKIKFEEYSKKLSKSRNTLVKEEKTHSGVTKIYLNAGKKKKIRAIDIVGTLCNVNGISNEDIGVIEICDLCSYVDLLNHKGEMLIKNYNELTIKKKSVKIRKDRNK